MKIAVIVDRMEVPRWAAAALARLTPGEPPIVYNCTNTPPSRKRARHALYYALNLFTVRNPMTRGVPLPAGWGSEIVDFGSEIEGAWQRLPDTLLARIAADRPDVILKFGMNLLRVPTPEQLAVPILSYHHGDPEHFRGRPAGFYEVLEGRGAMGQIVQILSNALDAGQVVAFAETKVHRHSYRATLMEAYRHSPLLLPRAIDNALAGIALDKKPTGRNYRLPSNGVVLRFVARLGVRALRRIAYGATLEKIWRVSTAPAPPVPSPAAMADDFPERPAWTTLPVPAGYHFLADPFFSPDGDGLLVEALNRRTHQGELLRLAGGAASRILDAPYHQSYPATVSVGETHFLVPEMSEGGAQRLFRLDGGRAVDAGALDVPGSPRLLDPTLRVHEGRLYLFANDAAEGPGVLRLWSAPSLESRFESHPASPILISPRGARMAGELLTVGDTLIRLGQDLLGDYGDGIVLHRVDALTPREYRETEVASLRFEDVRGPHTLQRRGDTFAFDWYTDRFNLLAGLRRLRMSRAVPGASPAP